MKIILSRILVLTGLIFYFVVSSLLMQYIQDVYGSIPASIIFYILFTIGIIVFVDSFLYQHIKKYLQEYLDG